MYDCENLKKHNRKVGVYCIFNISNGRRYVGSSNNLWRRFTEHRRQLKKRTHGNQFMQNDYVKSGSDMFLFFILQECQEETRLILEQSWLDAVWDGKVDCYNIEPKVESRVGWSPSIETRQRMSLAKKGKLTGPCSELRREAIRQSRAGKFNNWSPEGKRKVVESKQKTYIVELLAPDGTVYGPITNLHAFCREHDLDRASILRLINGKQGRVGMWKLANPIRIDRRFKHVEEDYKLRKGK